MVWRGEASLWAAIKCLTIRLTNDFDNVLWFGRSQERPLWIFFSLFSPLQPDITSHQITCLIFSLGSLALRVKGGGLKMTLCGRRPHSNSGFSHWAAISSLRQGKNGVCARERGRRCVCVCVCLPVTWWHSAGFGPIHKRHFWITGCQDIVGIDCRNLRVSWVTS